MDGVGYTTEIAYNALDKVTRLTYPDGFVVNCRYDPGSNLYQIAAGTSAYVTIPGYNAHRQPLTVNYGNGIGAQYTYEPNNWRMTALNTKNGSLQNRSRRGNESRASFDFVSFGGWGQGFFRCFLV